MTLKKQLFKSQLLFVCDGRKLRVNLKKIMMVEWGGASNRVDVNGELMEVMGSFKEFAVFLLCVEVCKTLLNERG